MAAARSGEDAVVVAGGGHCAAAVFNSSLCPSRASYTYFNDVWATTDGATWTVVAASAPWSARGGHSLTALASGTLVLAGGVNATQQMADVWTSADGGRTWRLATASAPWGGRSYHGAAAAGEVLVIVGGGNFTDAFNDAWRSTDAGATWVRMTPAAPWSPRFGVGFAAIVSVPTCGTAAPAFLLTGGYVDYPTVGTADVWLSCDDGATWVLDNAAAPWGNRSFQNMVAAPPPDTTVTLFGGWNLVGLATYHYLGDAWRGTLA